jgi:hypothetical protein
MLVKKSKKPLQTNRFFSILHAMRNKLKLTIIAAAFFGSVTFVSTTQADEQILADQTILTPTTIGDSDSMPIDFSGSDDSPVVGDSVFSASPSFSPEPAPEPSTFALGSMAIGLLAAVRLTRRQQA